MLKVEIDKNTECAVRIESSGSLKEILSEVCQTINGIYSRMKLSAEPALGDEFRRVLSLALIAPGSPVWEANPGSEESMSIIMPVERRG